VDAAVAVAGPGWADHRERVIDALGRLVDGSLLVLEHDSAGLGRYRLLDVIRDYARERAVERGETATLLRRHAEYYLALAERGEPHLRGPGQRDWHARLLAEESNLSSAMSWALELDDADMALRLAGALWMFWRWAGRFADGNRWLDAALALPGGSRQARLRALWGAGWLAYHHGDYARTGAAGRDILELAPRDDAVSRRNGLTLASIAALAVQNTDEAVAAAGEALSLAESIGPGWLLATSLLNLGTAVLAAGDVAAARPLYARALDEYTALGDLHFRARTLIQLGHCALEDGDRATACGFIDEAVEIAQEIGDLWGIAEGLEAAAVLAADAYPETAARLAGGAHHIREQIAMNAHPPDARFNRRYLERVGAALGRENNEAAWREGLGLPVESLQVLALRVTGAAPAS
jgi:tetratricopeptide (TPR) repeat protein